MNTWFTADIHFGHKNICKFTKRPFGSVGEMDEKFVENWNEVVRPDDKVFVLGDYSFRESHETEVLTSRLRGNKFLVRGNHDYTSRLPSFGFQWMRHYAEIKVGEDHIVMSHFPMMSWHKIHRGSYMLHGHCHGQLRLPQEFQNARIFDVGLDSVVTILPGGIERPENYRPIEWAEVKAHLANKVATSVDAHEIRS